MQSILPFLTKERVIDLKGQTKNDVLYEMAKIAVNEAIHEDVEALYDELLDRERLMSTGIGIGIAVPHTRCPETETFTVAIGRSAEGVKYDSLDGQPVHLVILIIAPGNDRREYLQLLAKVVMKLKDREFFQKLMDAPTPGDMYDIIIKEGNAE
ncbi:PTS sugar transporter subunit IIA [bacterium]|nr:PTS sugar transporter subunit IIA [bacterium]